MYEHNGCLDRFPDYPYEEVEMVAQPWRIVNTRRYDLFGSYEERTTGMDILTLSRFP